jgi:NAD-dependent dihydropyrimidine dehydrogenase PreA subunit
MKRQIIKIDEDLCTGCGLCIPNCNEGALKVIDGKVRLISDLFCDGLGACIGHCPEGAIELVEREAEAYNENLVIQELALKGKNTVVAHLEHLKDHGEFVYIHQAMEYLRENKIDVKFLTENNQKKIQIEELQHHHIHGSGGCPGSAQKSFGGIQTHDLSVITDQPSRLTQWPIQLHLINPSAGYFESADILLSADCVAYSLGSFHEKYLKGKKLLIACPKLDDRQDVYLEKIRQLIDDSNINSLTVMIMEVPCCRGLLQMAKDALLNATRKIPVKMIKVSIEGKILDDTWI